jgi:predicted TPR repeat methyltransferase
MDGNRTALFDELAETFDDDVGLESTKFPFGDYNESLSEIAAEARRLAPRPVVDLGCGTGALFARLQRDGTEVEAWGFDCSPRMLRRAPEKIPTARLLTDDIAGDLAEAELRRFGAIVSTYTFHEMPDERKFDLLVILRER